MTMFACCIALACAWVIIVTSFAIFYNGKSINDYEKWYSHKFKQLIGMFSCGLTIFTIVVSFLALIPRYDYERVHLALEDLQKKHELLNMQYEELKGVVITQYNEILAKKIEEGVSTGINSVMIEVKKLPPVIQQNQNNIKLIMEEMQKGKSATEKEQIKNSTQMLAVPEIDIPKVNIPKVNIPKVNIPKVRETNY